MKKYRVDESNFYNTPISTRYLTSSHPIYPKSSYVLFITDDKKMSFIQVKNKRVTQKIALI